MFLVVPILGKKLCEYPLIAASKSKYIERIFVSTDCKIIKKISFAINSARHANTNKLFSNKKLLYFSQKKIGAKRIFESKKNQTQDFIPIKSETICLDDYFEKQNLLKKIDFIKIDIEGSEFRAFNGMKKIL